MKHKDIVGVYSSILQQVQNKIGKTVNIYHPQGTTNIAVKEYEVTQSFIDMCLRRKSYWLGERQW